LNIFSYSNFKGSIGIILLWIGPPLIYFLKGYANLGSGSVFTGICYMLGIALMVNKTPVKIGYKPNILLFQFGITFLVISIFYFLFYNGDKAYFNTEIINFAFLFFYLLFLLKAKNDIQGYLPIILLITDFTDFRKRFFKHNVYSTTYPKKGLPIDDHRDLQNYRNTSSHDPQNLYNG